MKGESILKSGELLSGDVKCWPAAVYYPIDEAATLASQISRERGKVA
jgi:hypothetical protein